MKKSSAKLVLASAVVGALVTGPAIAPANAAGTVKIGVVEMITGGSAFYGQSVLEGIKIAQNEINKAGGVLGKQIEIVVKDNASDNAQTTSLITAFANDKTIPVVIPPTYQSNFLAACSAATAKSLPIVSAQSGPPAAANTKDFCWTMTADLGLQTTYMMKALVAKGYKKFAVVYDQDNGYVSWVRSDPWKNAFTNAGVTVEQIGVAKGTTDFGSQITKIVSGGYDAVFPFFTIEDAAPFITQASAGGYKGKFFDPVSQLTSLRLVTLAPKSIGLLAATPQTVDVPSFKKFVDAYKKANGKALDDPTYTGYGYDALKFIAEVMKKAGTTTDRAKINAAIKATKTTCASICFSQGTGVNKGAYIAKDNFLTQLTKTGYVKVK